MKLFKKIKNKLKVYCLLLCSLLSFGSTLYVNTQPVYAAIDVFSLWEIIEYILAACGIVTTGSRSGFDADALLSEWKRNGGELVRQFQEAYEGFVEKHNVGGFVAWSIIENSLKTAENGTLTVSKEVAYSLGTFIEELRGAVEKTGNLELAFEYLKMNEDISKVITEGGRMDSVALSKIVGLSTAQYLSVKDNFDKYLDYYYDNPTYNYACPVLYSYHFDDTAINPSHKPHTVYSFVFAYLNKITLDYALVKEPYPVNYKYKEGLNYLWYVCDYKAGSNLYEATSSSCQGLSFTIYDDETLNSSPYVTRTINYTDAYQYVSRVYEEWRWNTGINTRGREGYIDARVIDKSAVLDIYETPDLVKLLEQGLDWSRSLARDLAEALARVRAGELALADALALIRELIEAIADVGIRPGPQPEPDPEPDDKPQPKPKDINLLVDISELFPFCIAFDMFYALEYLKKGSSVPKAKIPIKIGKYIDYTIVIDFKDFEILHNVLKIGLLIFWIIGLIVATRKFIRW